MNINDIKKSTLILLLFTLWITSCKKQTKKLYKDIDLAITNASIVDSLERKYLKLNLFLVNNTSVDFWFYQLNTNFPYYSSNSYPFYRIDIKLERNERFKTDTFARLCGREFVRKMKPDDVSDFLHEEFMKTGLLLRGGNQMSFSVISDISCVDIPLRKDFEIRTVYEQNFKTIRSNIINVITQLDTSRATLFAGKLESNIIIVKSMY